MRYLIFLLLLIASPVSAQWQEARMNPYIVGSAGCTEPSPGTVIVGTSTTSTAWDYQPNADVATFWNVDLTASWAESCTTTTVGTIEFYVRPYNTANCKAYITTSGGTILTNGVSNALAIEAEGSVRWVVFTMGTPPTIIKSTDYKIALVCSVNGSVVFYYNNTGSNALCEETGGNYATPGNLSCDNTVDGSATLGGVRGKK
jgi:hypothetical protein